MATYRHFFLNSIVNSEKFKAPSAMGAKPQIPKRNRITHSEKLLQQFDVIWETKKQLEIQRAAEQIPTKEGTYLSFTSSADHDLITKSLEDLRKGIRLLNIKEIPSKNAHTQVRATVYVPKGKEGAFMGKIKAYRDSNKTSVTFHDQQDHAFVTEEINKLENNIHLKTIKDANKKGIVQTKATISLPVGQEDYFIAESQRLFPESKVTISPHNADLVNSIEDVGQALLESFWMDNIELIPDGYSKWCEVWLNINTKQNLERQQIEQFLSILGNIGIEAKYHANGLEIIIFPERAVLLIKANQSQLVELILQSDLLAEFRAGQEPAGFWVNESATEQQGWVEDVLRRVELIDSNVKICLLDSGVNNGHQLLKPLIDEHNTLTVTEEWGTNDHSGERGGHGTLMAGIAGYGHMEKLLISAENILLTHKICSVKILPRPGQEETPAELWGDVTTQAIARSEIQNPNIFLIYCLSVTAKEGINMGRPSSWSGAIDNLAFGEGENQRLIVISGGNIKDEELWQNYPDSNYVTSIQNPAQSWNALVIGAYTEKIIVQNRDFRNHIPIANQGELSPYSSTSIAWEKKWPSRPDVVFEGGNLLKAPDGSIFSHEDLEMLSTSKTFGIKPFDTINATSAAAAHASWFTAKIAFQYPDAWPETVRGLVIHSADWNPMMLNQIQAQQGNRTSFRNLLRTFGYGIPNLDRALYSQESAFTFISQEYIQPFSFKNGSRTDTETNEIHFFNLPWPSELLLEMGEIPVTFKVTLSYFIEPGAGEIGWKDKYRYGSHGLRFEVNNVGEREDEFKKRVNKAAREEDEEIYTNAGASRWLVGKDNRTNGSVHSDSWKGTAAELSTCHYIAVFPVVGWWRERKHLGKVETSTRYSLIISLETPNQEIELYTTVKNMVEIPIEINAR
ncbi:S8 family peptidase [Chryseobacterium scophthalmum]|uniref:S8 family peptidase n=1 Tax=Chryseobacterium scophthalmum TaxID=59733 RepID=UPI001AEBF145|nr:S8 family peptidase [Chryseobacterium scophthalmum]